MSSYNVAPLANLVDKFESLPSIGKKTAQRLALHIINSSKREVEDFSRAMLEAQEKIKYCNICCNLTDQPICSICQDKDRDKSTICVVEDVKDIFAFENTKEYLGTYHVLHGLISPLNAIGPDDIKIAELIKRIKSGTIKEVIMATNPTVEGEATAMYIAKLIKPFNVVVSRLAYGIPIGGDIEYADEVTLGRALEGRMVV